MPPDCPCLRYTGHFYSFRKGEISNVKAIVDWNASQSPRLFPSGLPAFSDRLGLPLQLYTPFWSDEYPTKYRMVESTTFKGTKLVTPNDSYPFFADLLDKGKRMTNGRFSTYEIDFLDLNFQGSAAMTEDVYAAERWYSGMARAADERRIAIQYCLPSATDMLVSLPYPSVVQARASGDYVSTEENVEQLGGSSLLMGAVGIAPSKDTLWTRSPQPPTYSDIKQHNDYTTQPHVALDAVLATLSLGPVGISDGLGQTDVVLISQAFRCATDSTLLRPSRPLSTIDSVFFNRSVGQPSADVRATHSTVAEATTHLLVAWRTKVPVALQPTDLYPAPSGTAQTRLAMRRHVLMPSDAHFFGCEDGHPAVPSCVHVLPQGGLPVLPATGGEDANFSLTAVYESLSNGAFFLGELNKFVPTALQRFESVRVSPGGACGIALVVKGAVDEVIRIAAVDPGGTVRLASVTIPNVGHVELLM